MSSSHISVYIYIYTYTYIYIMDIVIQNNIAYTARRGDRGSDDRKKTKGKKMTG